MHTNSSVKALGNGPPPLPALPDAVGGELAICRDDRRPSGPKTVGLLTSGHDLKVLLERTGYAAQPLDGAEKLDLLSWMADQVKENIGKRKKMKLAIKELDEFLKREGMNPKPKDAKSTISELLALRLRELRRLDYTRVGEQESDDARFQLALVAMPAEDVSNCFALVPYVEPEEALKGKSRACNLM
mmetsp:Transcript_87493/g.136959  ORF Transcript_87493/g.136959 Transcript_87493/m.136959 type:complete len:187 (+) Transcript_87493:41-601(+)